MDTEVPIRVYTQTSRQYLQKLYLQMAQYVGGTIDENGKLIELVQWDFWSFSNKSSLLFTFTSAIHQLWIWNNTLTTAYLNELFGVWEVENSKLTVISASFIV